MKDDNFLLKTFDIFLYFAQNIVIGTLEPSPQGRSNEYPQSMFWIKKKLQTLKCVFVSFDALYPFQATDHVDMVIYPGGRSSVLSAHTFIYYSIAILDIQCI